jgi:hypothetical protein
MSSTTSPVNESTYIANLSQHKKFTHQLGNLLAINITHMQPLHMQPTLLTAQFFCKKNSTIFVVLYPEAQAAWMSRLLAS